LRHAFRLLWKSKGITATTLVTLALGIGATTAIFSTVYSLMLKPLPYQEPERIVELYSSATEVLGKEVRIDDEAYKVFGVAPRALEAFDARMKFVVPLSWPPAAENPQGRSSPAIYRPAAGPGSILSLPCVRSEASLPDRRSTSVEFGAHPLRGVESALLGAGPWT
jgi:hypothetical protein